MVIIVQEPPLSNIYRLSEKNYVIILLISLSTEENMCLGNVFTHFLATSGASLYLFCNQLAYHTHTHTLAHTHSHSLTHSHTQSLTHTHTHTQDRYNLGKISKNPVLLK